MNGRKGPFNDMTEVEHVRPEGTFPPRSLLAIAGAGPIGLEAAALAASRGWDVAVFERGQLAQHLEEWGHVRLFSPFSMNHSDWGVELVKRSFPNWVPPAQDALLTGRRYRQLYLQPLSQIPELRSRILTGVEVIEIGKDHLGKSDWIGDPARLNRPFRLLLRRGDREGIHRAEAVIDATGVYSCPRPLGNGNIPAPGEQEALRQAPHRIHFKLVDLVGRRRREFAGKRILLVGGGYSAATHLEALAELCKSAPETQVIWVNWSRRDPPFQRFENDPLPYRDDLGRLGNRLSGAPPSWLTFLGHSAVEAIHWLPGHPAESGKGGHFEVAVGTPAAGRRRLQVDQILASVGFRPDTSVYRQLQVHECYATSGPIQLSASLLGGSGDCLAHQSQGIELLRNPEPNFFILGNKSYGTVSTFLLKHGIEQVRTVMKELNTFFAGREFSSKEPNYEHASHS
ncbi:MAG: hypothetical protein ACE5JX_06370 [Acidobacteriota bacterium]